MVVRTGEWISEGWQLLTEDFWMHVLVAVIFLAINGSGIGVLVVGPLLCGYYLVILQKLRNPGQRLDINGIGEGLNCFLDAFLVSLLIGVFVVAATCVCILPGFIVHGLLFFAYALVIDRRMGFWDAISESWRVAGQNWLGFAIFDLVLGVVCVLITFLTCGLGALVALPLATIARALAYRDNFGLEGGGVAARQPAPPPPPPAVSS